MASIYVDVDMSEFDADDLINELGERCQHDRLNEQEIKMLAELSDNAHLTKASRIKTLADRMKYETFMKNFDEITEQDLDFILENKYQKLRKA